VKRDLSVCECAGARSGSQASHKREDWPQETRFPQWQWKWEGVGWVRVPIPMRRGDAVILRRVWCQRASLALLIGRGHSGFAAGQPRPGDTQQSGGGEPGRRKSKADVDPESLQASSLAPTAQKALEKSDRDQKCRPHEPIALQSRRQLAISYSPALPAGRLPGAAHPARRQPSAHWPPLGRQPSRERIWQFNTNKGSTPRWRIVTGSQILEGRSKGSQQLPLGSRPQPAAARARNRNGTVDCSLQEAAAQALVREAAVSWTATVRSRD